MFTGLVEGLAPLAQIVSEPPGKRLALAAPQVAATAQIGDSIALNGCCLTVVAIENELLWFEAGPETLSRTNLGQQLPGQQVNFERSLQLNDRLGGHLVSGHVDAVTELVARHDHGSWSDFWFHLPAEFAGQVASKGSVAIDGVSLTVVAVEPHRFSVQLIPHTLAVTTLGALIVGSRVNLETDLLAKYVERQLQSFAQRSR
jgi:riboflavin synthase